MIFIERGNINIMLTNKKVAIIGVGKIGETLLNGMIKNNLVKKENIAGSTRLSKNVSDGAKPFTK